MRLVPPLVIAMLVLGTPAAAHVRAAPAAPFVAAAPLRTTVYFLADGGAAPIGVRRTLPRRSPHALRALEALLAGPSASERRRGLTTAVPGGVRIVSFSIRRRAAGSEAIVSLAGLPPLAGVRPGRQPSVMLRIRVLTQVARTLIGLSDVHRVRLRVRGRPWDLPRLDGRLGDRATGYGRLVGWWRVCTGRRDPDERALGLSRCFAALP